MIIDCHMHIRGGGPGWPVFGTDQILRAMDSAGIDRAVLFAMCEDSRTANRRVREVCSCHPDRFIGFAYALPSFVYDVAAETRRAVEEDGFRGVKLHFGETNPRPHVLRPLFESIADLRVPVLVDTAGHVDEFLEINDRFPDQTLVAAHLGNAGLAGAERIARAARQSGTLYLDTSWVRDTHMIGRSIEISGARNVLFGTDGPEVRADVELYKIRVLKLPPEDEALILGGNIARLVGLPDS